MKVSKFSLDWIKVNVDCRYIKKLLSKTAENFSLKRGSQRRGSRRLRRRSVLIIVDPSEVEMRNRDEAGEGQEEVEQLLLSILVPSFPPNRSQWKKLEIALDFIKKSRSQTRMRRRQEPSECARLGSVSCNTSNFLHKALRGLIIREFPDRSPAAATIYANNIISALPQEKFTAKNKMLRLKHISWSKLKRSLQKIMWVYWKRII